MCDVCQTRRSFSKTNSGKPIVSVGFLTRLQVDLIDMRSISHEGYNSIMHAQDHFTKFSRLCALPSKEAVHVANNLRNIFYTFGSPKILQLDNGKKAKVILDLKIKWPDLTIINGRPRQPENQELVERSNAVVQKMLGKSLVTNKLLDWPNGFGPVMFTMHNCISQSTQKTPYEMELHKQSKNTLIVNEEEIDQSITDNSDLFNKPFTTKDSADVDILSSISKLSLNLYETEAAESGKDPPHKRIRDEAEKCYLHAAG